MIDTQKVLEREELPLYVNHAGTVLVAGGSQVGKVAWYIIHLIKQQVKPIELFFIGANAGHQAYKACAVATLIARDEMGKELGFITRRARTQTEKRDITGKVEMKDSQPVVQFKDAYLWRIVDLTESEIGS